MKIEKERLDVLLVEQGLTVSRSNAQALVLAGEVRVNSKPASKPGMKIPRDSKIELISRAPYVGRGGYKLAQALDDFAFDVTDLVCADVGASTGGFTDVLLQRGARRVYAIDVGYGQLDWKLRNDERVVVMERTNARYLERLPEQVDFTSVDVSFISLKLIIPKVTNWMSAGGQIIALIKPQFEAGPEKVEKGGVIRKEEVHRNVLEDIFHWSISRKLYPTGLVPSPIKGASGNQEFLILLNPKRECLIDIEEAINRCFRQVT
ncbi:MAG: TlyA family rRNA (cytidine-2'-O)-methyltransferase [Anaerolineae bacterium]|nr:MAG: TlyA family rRNA (cytidine-2'-O)-methyltransferase [Anaerolineae bacterium]